MDEHESTPGVTRRQALRAGVGAAAGAATLGVAGAGAASAQQDAYDGYLAEADWDGNTVDASEVDEVVVDVGAGGGLQFGPPAIYVEPGTTIQWVWTGDGGAHNVVHDVDDRIFDSRPEHDGDTIADQGFTYEYTVEEEDEGAHPYVCTPHRGVEMKGVVVVGEENVETDLVGLDGGDVGLNMGSVAAGTAVFSVIALLGVAAYRDLVGELDE